MLRQLDDDPFLHRADPAGHGVPNPGAPHLALAVVTYCRRCLLITRLLHADTTWRSVARVRCSVHRKPPEPQAFDVAAAR